MSSTSLPDLWEGCYAGSHRQQSPESFKQTFCSNCLNSGCRNSKASGMSWVNRIMTQEERLLNNPLFADERDSLFSAIRDLDFKDMLHKALALEISDRKNDWTIPTESEISEEAARLTGGPHPAGYHHHVQEPEIKTTVVIEDKPKDSWTVKGDRDLNYLVTKSDNGSWACACDAFKFSNTQPAICKHIELVSIRLSRGVKESPPESVLSQLRAPPINTHLASNTKLPEGGVLIGGLEHAPQQATHDPWAIPEKKLAIGGRVVLGGGSFKSEKE